MSDRLCIFLHDLALELPVGYYETEKAAPQPVIVSVDCHMAPLRGYHTADGDLSTVLDYAALYDYLTGALPQEPHCAFLETLADRIMAFCWQDPRVSRIRVKLTKPAVLPQASAVGIVLERARPGSLHAEIRHS